MMGDKCVRDKASNVMDCVMDMTEVEEENIDMEVPDNISEVGPSSDETSRVGVGSPGCLGAWECQGVSQSLFVNN